jgi:hypothetical protein
MDHNPTTNKYELVHFVLSLGQSMANGPSAPLLHRFRAPPGVAPAVEGYPDMRVSPSPGVFFPQCNRVSEQNAFHLQNPSTRQRSHRSFHRMSRKIFADVEEREREERKRSLLHETTTYKSNSNSLANQLGIHIILAKQEKLASNNLANQLGKNKNLAKLTSPRAYMHARIVVVIVVSL